jgi:hypothetical protein
MQYITLKHTGRGLRASRAASVVLSEAVANKATRHAVDSGHIRSIIRPFENLDSETSSRSEKFLPRGPQDKVQA